MGQRHARTAYNSDTEQQHPPVYRKVFPNEEESRTRVQKRLDAVARKMVQDGTTPRRKRIASGVERKQRT